MIKKLLTITLSLMMIFTSFVPVFAEGEEVNIVGQYGIVIDKDTGQVLYNKNAHDKMYPASITKILTCIVAIEMLDDLDKTATITQSDIDTVWETGATSADFTVGEVVTYRDMLMGAMLPSGADACRALANNTCGSQEKFVEKMNQLVNKLGLKDSHFVNTTGIHDDDHYTTAYDLYLIFNECLKYDLFKDAIHQAHYTAVFTRNGQEVQQTYDSTNYYLLGNKTPPEGVSIIGGKTGTTDNAGLCLILYVEDGSGNGYISVLLGCPDKDTLYSSMSKLLSDISK